MSTARVLLQPRTLPQQAVRSAYSVGSENLALISSAALFQGLTDWECQEITYYAGKRIFARNHSLFAQGEPVRELILLKSGSVKHTQVAANGNEVLLRFCTAGDFANVFTGCASYTHSCAARATRPTVALVWDFARIHRFLEQCPQMRRNISRILAAQLEEMEDRFRELATENVSRRLALLVSRLAAQIGRATSEGIKISITREELAQMTGSTVFTVSRLLATWSAQGSLLSRRESVIVPDNRRMDLDRTRVAAMHCSSSPPN
jgi:CRP/FNR family transcriptional regulator, nitrogen oxide reductase regulator